MQIDISLGPRCNDLLQGDPPGPPYWLRKWVDATNSTSFRAVKRSFTTLCQHSGRCQGNPPQTESKVSISVFIVCIILLSGFLFVWRARGQSKNEVVFQTAAKTDSPNVQITRHFDHGPETISGQGMIVKHKPEDQLYPGELKRRLRSSEHRSSQDISSSSSSSSSISRSITQSSWPSHNTSASTLVAPLQDPEKRRPSAVSLHDHTANVKHEGLIELDFNGKRKAFFKPSTSEFFHIAPWKSTHSDDEDSAEEDERTKQKQKAEEKNLVHRALGQFCWGRVMG